MRFNSRGDLAVGFFNECPVIIDSMTGRKTSAVRSGEQIFPRSIDEEITMIIIDRNAARLREGTGLVVDSEGRCPLDPSSAHVDVLFIRTHSERSRNTGEGEGVEQF